MTKKDMVISEQVSARVRSIMLMLGTSSGYHRPSDTVLTRRGEKERKSSFEIH